jgi:hypothetical protein
MLLLPSLCAAVAAVGFEDFNASTVPMGGQLPVHYKNVDWEGFQVSFKKYMYGQGCNASNNIGYGSAIGDNAAYIRLSDGIRGQAGLKVVNAPTDTLSLIRGLYLWSIVVSPTQLLGLLLHSIMSCPDLISADSVTESCYYVTQVL